MTYKCLILQTIKKLEICATLRERAPVEKNKTACCLFISLLKIFSLHEIAVIARTCRHMEVHPHSAGG